MRAYLATHDYSILLNHPYPYIPCAEPGFLKQCLDDPSLVAVLPPNLVPGHAAAESDVVVAVISQLYWLGWAVVVLGLVLGARGFSKEMK